MTPESILALITHGGPLAITGLLWYLYTRAEKLRIAAEERERKTSADSQALVIGMVKEFTLASAQFVRATEENTRSTTALAEGMHMHTDKINKLIEGRENPRGKRP